MVTTLDTSINTLLTRGVVEVIGGAELTKRLRAGETLRVKLGIDPTSPHLHLGRSIPLLKLRDFQQAGHTIVFIVGDFTGVIGDTSDKDSERPMLLEETIKANMQTYFAQVGKVIDLERAELRHNSEWLGPLTYREIGAHADCFSVADFIARDNIKKRLDAGKRVSLREVLYPLMQGYDSVAVRADVEVGGTDQRFNLLAGRTLQERAEQTPQSIIMNPLIAGLDGRKMSSSWGNTINLNDGPEDMYGKVMSLRDDLVGTYFEVCTRVSMDDVRAIVQGLADGTFHPKDAKMRLAHEVVALYHGEPEAMRAEESFVHTFQKGGVPEHIEKVVAHRGEECVEVLLRVGMISSKTEWRRLVEAGAVEVMEGEGCGEKIGDIHACVISSAVLRVGKKRFISIIAE